MTEKEISDMPKALRLLAEQIQAPDHVPAMCLRDAAAMIESLAMDKQRLDWVLAATADELNAFNWQRDGIDEMLSLDNGELRNRRANPTTNEILMSDKSVDKNSPPPDAADFSPATCSALEWKKGPALGGEGTAGGDWWNDGDWLIIVVDTVGKRRVFMVRVSCDVDYFGLYDQYDDYFDDYSIEDVSWYAVLDTKHLPNGEATYGAKRR